MKTTKKAKVPVSKRILLLLLACLLLASAGSAEDPVQNTQEPPTQVSDMPADVSSTPAPTATPSPTDAPSPTETPSSTATPSPTETPSPKPESTEAPETTAASTSAPPTSTPASDGTSAPDPTATEAPTPSPTPAADDPESPTSTESPTASPAASSSPAPDHPSDPEPEKTPSPSASFSPDPADPDATATNPPEASPSPSPADTTSEPTETSTHTPVPSSDPGESPTEVPSFEWMNEIEDAELKNQIWYLTVHENSTITIRWNAYPSADQYAIRVESPELESPITETVSSLFWSCDSSRLPSGTLNISIDALCQGISLDQIVFQLVLTDDSANPTPTPEQTPVQPTPTSEATPAPAPTPTNETVTPDNNSESDGNERSAGRKISPASFTFRKKNSSASKNTNTVTAGKALISSHASGTGDLTPHDAIELELPEDELSTLYLGDTGLQLSADSGTFTASSIENQLYLSSVDDACTFSFSQAALNLLGNSGVDQLSLVAGEHELTLDTAFDLNGFYYGQYRSKGYVSSDFVFHVSQSHILVSIEDKVFELSEENELVPSSLQYSSAFGGNMP